MRTRTNPFFLVAGLYFTVGLLAVLDRVAVGAGVFEALPRVRWLTIHLVTIGGMTQALFGALPALAGVEAPRRERWLAWLGLNAGYPLVLVGMTAGSAMTAVAGATVVLGGLAVLIRTVLRAPRDTDGVGRSRFYRTAPWFLVVGVLAAFGMLLGIHGPGGYFGSIEAHVHANVWGFLALVAAGALLAVVPALADVDLRYPRLVPVTFWGVTLGAAGLVAGPWLAHHELTFAGLAVYVVGTAALLVNVVATYRATRGVDSRLAHVVGAYVWLAFPVPWAPFVLLYPGVLPGAAIETAAIDGLVFGWMLQLAAAFLPAVVRHGPRALAARDADAAGWSRPSWVSVAGANLGVLALWATVPPALAAVDDLLTVAGFALVAVAWAAFAVDLWRALTAPGDDGGAGSATAAGD